MHHGMACFDLTVAPSFRARTCDLACAQTQTCKPPLSLPHTYTHILSLIPLQQHSQQDPTARAKIYKTMLAYYLFKPSVLPSTYERAISL